MSERAGSAPDAPPPRSDRAPADAHRRPTAGRHLGGMPRRSRHSAWIGHRSPRARVGWNLLRYRCGHGRDRYTDRRSAAGRDRHAGQVQPNDDRRHRQTADLRFGGRLRGFVRSARLRQRRLHDLRWHQSGDIARPCDRRPESDWHCSGDRQTGSSVGRRSATHRDRPTGDRSSRATPRHRPRGARIPGARDPLRRNRSRRNTARRRRTRRRGRTVHAGAHCCDRRPPARRTERSSRRSPRGRPGGHRNRYGRDHDG